MNPELRKVKRAAAKTSEARAQLEAAIRKARGAGLPLREVGKAADMSYETVRRICQ